jgi:phage terminase large subunit
VLATAAELIPAHRLYRPHGAALSPMRYRGPEVLVSGPAGTGKSRGCPEKVHSLAELCPGMRGLILRKTRESLTESALETFEKKVVPEGHPILSGARRDTRKLYAYPNGSVIVVGGLKAYGRDQTQEVMSTEYDAIYVQEAIELIEEEWELCTTRLRNGNVPFQRLMADTNPGAPTHWLKRRCDAGKCHLLHSRHEDNPRLWDGGAWPEEVRDYITKPDALTGARYHCLRHGRWVQAEGAVYEGWDPGVHLIERPAIPQDWGRYWSIDFGFTQPSVCQFWAKDPDGRLYMYREIYRTQRLVEDHARDILDIVAPPIGPNKQRQWKEPRPRAVICDHDAEDRATLERHLGIMTTAANKTRTAAIQAVAAELRAAGDGRPRLFITNGALVHRDRALEDAKKPAGTVEEFDCYVWDLTNNRMHGEEPVEENDNGMDAMRYVVAQFNLQPQATRRPQAFGGVPTMPGRW